MESPKSISTFTVGDDVVTINEGGVQLALSNGQGDLPLNVTLGQPLIVTAVTNDGASGQSRDNRTLQDDPLSSRRGLPLSPMGRMHPLPAFSALDLGIVTSSSEAAYGPIVRNAQLEDNAATASDDVQFVAQHQEQAQSDATAHFDMTDMGSPHIPEIVTTSAVAEEHEHAPIAALQFSVAEEETGSEAVVLLREDGVGSDGRDANVLVEDYPSARIADVERMSPARAMLASGSAERHGSLSDLPDQHWHRSASSRLVDDMPTVSKNFSLRAPAEEEEDPILLPAHSNPRNTPMSSVSIAKVAKKKPKMVTTRTKTLQIPSSLSRSSSAGKRPGFPSLAVRGRHSGPEVTRRTLQVHSRAVPGVKINPRTGRIALGKHVKSGPHPFTPLSGGPVTRSVANMDLSKLRADVGNLDVYRYQPDRCPVRRPNHTSSRVPDDQFELHSSLVGHRKVYELLNLVANPGDAQRRHNKQSRVRNSKNKMVMRSKSTMGWQIIADSKAQQGHERREASLYQLHDESVVLLKERREMADDSISTLASFDKFLRRNDDVEQVEKFQDVETRLRLAQEVMSEKERTAQVHPFINQLEFDLKYETFDCDPGPTSWMVWRRQQQRGNATSI